MSKLFKTGLAVVASFFLASTLYAQATIEEVIVTAQRTEQSLQDVPIAVSAFTDEMLTDRQIEFASDIQLQVPGVSYSATAFGSGGFAIRGISNFAVAASADAGVELHVNGLPMGNTSTNEQGFLDMARIEVLRGPQGTLFGRNSTGGVINLITARPDLDEFYGNATVRAGKYNQKEAEVMLNIPVSDTLGLRLAYSNIEKDGVFKNMYSQSTGDFDSRDSYQWRATLMWEATDETTFTLIHNAFDEESNRTQADGVWCETGGNLVQGCVMGGTQQFQAIHPMSNGSTLPGLLGGTLGFYTPNITNGAVGTGTTYNGVAGTTIENGVVPNDYFTANVWRSPTHDVQESNSQFILDHDFDNGALTVSYNNKKRQFYRDTSSLSSEASAIRWSANVQALPFYKTSSDPNGAGLPLGYSNDRISPECAIAEFKAGIFCPNSAGIRGNHILPVSGDAFAGDYKSTTYEVKYVSDLDGMFNFLVGGIDISNETNSYYDVYASGITLNALHLPSTIAASTRTAYHGVITCGIIGAAACAAVTGDAASGAATAALGAGILTGLAPAVAAYAANGVTVTADVLARDMVSRIDGLYTEFFHNVTDAYNLDSKAIFAEFYFDVADGHKLTLGLRQNEDVKKVSVNATFYKVPLLSNWATASAAACGIQANGTAGSLTATPAAGNGFAVAETAACFTSNGNALDGLQANTQGQQVGQTPTATGLGNTNGSQIFGALPANNADYAANGVNPVKEFSEVTGRLVWDWQINDDVLLFASFAQGFKGGGFNPPFNAAQFPDTPFAFESTEVQSLEIGVKASVPEVGLIANASIYYNDFKNYHIGTIRNETAINTGLPLENMGAELELYLTPPDVPGLTFNAMLSYQSSEIGNFSSINPYDMGGHYRQQTSSTAMQSYTDWHVAKNQTANSFLVNKTALGYMYGKILDVQLIPAAAAAASAAGGGDATAQATASANALAGLRGTNEIAFGLTCTAVGDCDAGDTAITAAQLVNIVPFEMSAHAVGYGNLGKVCHFLTAVGGGNSCMPVAAGGTAGIAPTTSLVYSPQANASGSAGPTGELLPSVIVRGTGTALQTGGICGLFKAMTDFADDVTGGANELTIGANEVCLSTATQTGKWLSGGLEQNLTGNEMPFADLTLSLGIAYTFQTANVEVTPRLDYYYQSEAYSDVFNIETLKIPAWDEWNFSLFVVPTDGDWNIRLWAQNLTDDRNVTGSAVGNSSVGHTTSVFVREPRSFGMAFGYDF